MNKISKLSLCAALFAFSISCAYADGMVFEPVEMPTINNAAPANSIPEVPSNQIVAAPAETPVEIESSGTTTKTSFFDQFKLNNQPKVADMSLKENQDMQSALVNLDTSQVELRQNLQSLEAKYYYVDANYQKYKEERATLHKQIKVTNKKLKNIENVKNKIRKNML